MKVSTLFTILITISLHVSVQAQFISKLIIEKEFNVKFSMGKEVRETLVYDPGFTINYPKSAFYQNPVLSFELSSLFPLTNNFHVGISAGIAVALDEKDPLNGYQHFHRFMIPLVCKFRYTILLPSEFELSSEGRIGYQFTRSKFGLTDEGFIYTQSGGIINGLKFQLAKKIGKYSPFFCIGYELNRILNDVSLGQINGYDYHDKYQFTTNFHLLILGIGLKM